MRDCLDQLIKQVRGDEIIVVDNGTNSAEMERLRIDYPEVRWLENTKKQNPYTSRNIGISASSFELIAFLDARCKAHPDWLATAKSVLSDPSIDILVGDFEMIPSGRNLKDLCFGIIYLHNARNVEKQFGTPIANSIIKKSLFEHMGLFPDKLISGNDIIWTEKIWLHKKIHYSADLIVSYHGKSLEQLMSDIKKYACAAAQHRNIKLWHAIRLLLPMRISNFTYATRKRKIRLPFYKQVYLYLLCSFVKQSYGFHFLRKKFLSWLKS